MDDRRTAWFGVAMLLLGGCSVVFDPKTDQCQLDQDCTRFRADSVCDVGQHVCVLSLVGNDPGIADGGPRDGDVGSSRDGVTCPAATDAGRGLFVTSCTGAVCIPFDNARRVTRFSPDGTLAPLPVKP